MFTHMQFVTKESYAVRGTTFELLVYHVIETHEYRIFVAKNGFSAGDIFCATQEVISDAAGQNAADIVAELIALAKDDITRNEFKQY